MPELNELPSKEYIHSTVVDDPLVTWAVALEILWYFSPIIIRTVLVAVWIYLLASLLLGKF